MWLTLCYDFMFNFIGINIKMHANCKIVLNNVMNTLFPEEMQSMQALFFTQSRKQIYVTFNEVKYKCNKTTCILNRFDFIA